MKREPTKMQFRFANEYLLDMNATQSAKRAGYKSDNYNSLRKQGQELMSLPHIQEIVAKLQAKRLARLEIKQDDVVKELAMICFSDPSDMFDENSVLISPKKWSKALRRSVQAIDVFKFNAQGVPTDFRVRFWDKNKALEKMGLHLGMFGDKGVGDKPHATEIKKRWTMEFVDAKPDPKRAALEAPKPDKSNGRDAKEK